MNLNDILRRAHELKNPEHVKLLWFLHSLISADCGAERFAKEFEEWFPDTFNRLQAHGRWGDNPLASELTNLTNGFGERADVTKALVDYMRRAEQIAAQSYYLTNVGRAVWETLDWCLEEHRPCFIEGFEGRGKSASAQAWQSAHRGEARYVSLPGLGLQRDFFAAIANAYGVPFSNRKAPNEVRWRLRDVIVRSGLILIIDEAHFCLPERSRAGRPPLVDWIDSELCNAGVATCLISTHQFGVGLAEFENRTSWRAGQFKRRFSGCWRRLDDKTGEADLIALSQNFLPQVGSKGIKLAVGYAGTFGRDVSGLFDLIRDAQRRARKAGRSAATYQDLRDAYELDRVPTENAMAAAFKRPAYQRPGESLSDNSPDHSEAKADPPHWGNASDADRHAAVEISPQRFFGRGTQPAQMPPGKTTLLHH